jgi:hypothetical protein
MQRSIRPATSRPSARLSPTKCARRCIHATPARNGSPLFALGALANSRESQFFRQVSKLSPVEHSPPLELIRSSEVKPFNPFPRRHHPPPPAPGLATIRIRRPQEGITSSAPRVSTTIFGPTDTQAISIGRTILVGHARRVARLERSLRQADKRYERERAAWVKENRRLAADNKSASVITLVAIAVATGLATWKFYPSKDLGALGAHASTPPPATLAVTDLVPPSAVMAASVPVVEAGNDLVQGGTALSETRIVKPLKTDIKALVPVDSMKHTQSGWRSWFWKEG